MAGNNASVAAMLAKRRAAAPPPIADCGLRNAEDEGAVEIAGNVSGVLDVSEVDLGGFEQIHVSARVSCLLGGALMEVTVMGMAPEKVLAYLRSKDPNVQFQTEFPKRGGFGGGAKEVKAGLLNSLTIKGGKYPGVEMVVLGDDGEPASVCVGKNKLESWPAEFVKIATEMDAAKSAEYLGGKEGAFTRLASQLADGAAVTVKYSVFNGKAYFEALEVAA